MSLRRQDRRPGGEAADAASEDPHGVRRDDDRRRRVFGELDAGATALFSRHHTRSGPALVYKFPGTVRISVNDEVAVLLTAA